MQELLQEMKIGYARVSTQDQKLDLQLKALKKAGCQKIFREKVSGLDRQRPEFQRMLDQIRPGDTIVVWRLDRLARSTRDLLNTMETINEAGGKFRVDLGAVGKHHNARRQNDHDGFRRHRRVRAGSHQGTDRGRSGGSQSSEAYVSAGRASSIRTRLK